LDSGEKENDGESGGERELEPHIEKIERVYQEEEESAKRNRIEEAGIFPEKLADKIDQAHDDSAKDRGPALHQQGIKEKE
jgi:hypothetical protein